MPESYVIRNDHYLASPIVAGPFDSEEECREWMRTNGIHGIYRIARSEPETIVSAAEREVSDHIWRAVRDFSY